MNTVSHIRSVNYIYTNIAVQNVNTAFVYIEDCNLSLKCNFLRNIRRAEFMHIHFTLLLLEFESFRRLEQKPLHSAAVTKRKQLIFTRRPASIVNFLFHLLFNCFSVKSDLIKSEIFSKTCIVLQGVSKKRWSHLLSLIAK